MPENTKHLGKQYDDIIRCLICSSKFCMRWCPTFDATKSESSFSAGLNHFALGILNGFVDYSPSAVRQIYSCLSCGSCRDIRCVAEYFGPSVDTPRIVEAMRTDIVDAGKAPEEVATIALRVEATHNVFGDPPLSALPSGAESVGIAGCNHEMLYFAGCSVLHRYPQLAEAALRVFAELGATVGMLPDEWCCGMPLLSMGYRGLAEKMARHNVELINASGARKVSFSCPTCYRAFKERYPEEFGLHLEVEPCLVLDYIDDSIQSGRLELNREFGGRVTIHDSCSLALALKQAELPRRVLSCVPGLDITEMKRSGSEMRCCGGATWVKALFPELTTTHGRRRLEDVAETGITTIATVCPNCFRTLKDAVAAGEAQYRVVDVVEIVSEAI